MDRRELEAFEAKVLADDEVRRMLEDAACGVAIEAPPQSPTRVDPTLGLWLVGLTALWQLAKIGIHHLRGMSDSAVLQQQAKWCIR
jgi:hypothetical protein